MIKIDAHYPGAHYQLSRILFIEGLLPDALQEISKELECYPEYKRPYHIHRLVYGHLKMYTLAVKI